MTERPRVQHYVQLLIALCGLIMLAAVALIDAARVTPLFLLGVAVMVAGAVAMTLVWRARPTRHTAWIALVPLLDILAVVPVRDASVTVLPATGILVIFPIGWLAFAFPWPTVAAGVLLTTLVPAVGVFRDGFSADGAAAWVQFLALPVVMALYATTIRVIARDLMQARERAEDISERLSRLARESSHDGAIFRALMDATDDAVALFDVRGERLLLNATARRFTDRAGVTTLNDPAGATLLFEDDGVTPIRTGPAFVERVRRGEFAQPRLMSLGPEGDQTVARVIVRPVRSGDEEVGMMAVGQDITELVRAVDVRDRFLRTVGHELRTPLTVILGQAELALMADGPDRDRWDAVERAAERLHRLVERLLAAGHAEVEVHGGTAHLGEVVRRAVQETLPLAAPRGIRIMVEGDDLARARVGAHDLEVIVAELLRNAVNFTPEGGGDVHVRFGAEGDRAFVEVRDTGVGMTDAERAQAFDRFYRAPYAHRSAVPGAGLGLSLIGPLAAAHGGAIALDANTPRGTRATVHLPAA